MAKLTLSAKKREKTTKAGLANMRREGRVPAVVYGLEKEPELVEVTAPDMRAHLAQLNHVIDLQLDGGGSQQVMIKAVERDPIRKDLMHIDFLRVNNERPVIVNVPVKPHGVPVGVKTEGGVFSVMKKFVKVKSKVQDIPDSFEWDVSELSAGIIIYVKDLKFPKGTFVTPAKTALFGVTTGKTDEEVAPTPTPAAAAAATAPAGAPSAPGVAPKEEAKGKEKEKK